MIESANRTPAKPMKSRGNYTIAPAPNGGYIVNDSNHGAGQFASTTLDEALRYIRAQLIPPDPEFLPEPGETEFHPVRTPDGKDGW